MDKKVELLTPPQAARLIGCSARTIQRWAQAGKKFPGAFVTASGYKIPKKEVMEYIKKRDKK